MIDINFHPDYVTTQCRIFRGSKNPFVTFEMQTNGGSVTLYLRDMKDAERIAQGAVDLLSLMMELEKEKG